MATTTRFDEITFQWEHLERLASQYKRHLRHLFLAVDFASSKAQDPLIEAVDFLKLETLKEANDLVNNGIAELPIFRHYHVEEALHQAATGSSFTPSNLGRKCQLSDAAADSSWPKAPVP